MDAAEELMLMFQKMGTTDHDTLLKQFLTIIPGLDEEVARFFLEANSWTLQSAITSFFENQGNEFKRQMEMLNRQQKPQMSFEQKDDGILGYPVGTRFKKVWNIKNTGTVPWPTGTTLDHIGGDTLGAKISIPIPPLPPGEGGDLAIDFVAPQQPGEYHGSWMMCTIYRDSPIHFGEPIWVLVSVTAPPQFGFGGFQQPTFMFNPQQLQPNPQQLQQPAQFGPLFQQQLNHQNPFMFGNAAFNAGARNPSMNTF